MTPGTPSVSITHATTPVLREVVEAMLSPLADGLEHPILGAGLGGIRAGLVRCRGTASHG